MFKNFINDQDIFLIGGGNSLDISILKKIPPENIIAINSSVYHLSKCLAIGFMDSNWYKDNKNAISHLDIKYKFFIQRFKPNDKDCIWIERIGNSCDYENDAHNDLSVRGNNTGCSMINLLDKLNAKNVFLIGFDCKRINGKSHSHNHYPFNLSENFFRDKFFNCFNTLSKNLKNCTVYNCTINTNLTMFPYYNIWKHHLLS